MNYNFVMMVILIVFCLYLQTHTGTTDGDRLRVSSYMEYHYSASKDSIESISIMGREGSSVRLIISAPGSWTVKCSTDWLTVNKKSGSGPGQVQITAQENHDIKGRTARIIISQDGLPARIIEIYQKPVHEE